jgi:replication-associated recombination protein RarA
MGTRIILVLEFGNSSYEDLKVAAAAADAIGEEAEFHIAPEHVRPQHIVEAWANGHLEDYAYVIDDTYEED